MDYIDLHVHTSASDGTLSGKELVHHALEKGLYAIAITDHETVDAVEEAKKEALGTDLIVIPGIELSADYLGNEIHILGYNMDYQKEDFLKELNILKNARALRNEQMLQKLNEKGIEISSRNIYERFQNASITRAHIAQYLIEHGYVKEKKEAFDKYIGKGRPCYVERARPDARVVLGLIQSADGIPVLAHPLQYQLTGEELAAMVQFLKSYGLKGIEAIYSSYSIKEESDLRRLARLSGLFITGGSDFHGDIKPDIKLGTGKGNLKIPKEILSNIGG